jgi:hypothetical protein
MDNNKKTRWSSQHKDGEWICLDLGKPTLIKSVRLHFEQAYATRYQLERGNSIDGPWNMVKYEQNSKGGIEEIQNLKIVTQFVRLKAIERATAYGMSLYEFEVRGTQAKSCMKPCDYRVRNTQDASCYMNP